MKSKNKASVISVKQPVSRLEQLVPPARLQGSGQGLISRQPIIATLLEPVPPARRRVHILRAVLGDTPPHAAQHRRIDRRAGDDFLRRALLLFCNFFDLLNELRVYQSDAHKDLFFCH